MRPLAFAALLALAACSSSTPDPPPPTNVALPRGCDEAQQIEPSEDRSHVDPGTQVEYATDPPTSGPHFTRWEDTGIHDAPIPDGNQLHNLEHGHVVVQHQGLTPEQLAQLRAAVVADPFMMVMAPRPQMSEALALTAWGAIQTCDRFPNDVAGLVSGFAARFRNHAPESIP